MENKNYNTIFTKLNESLIGSITQYVLMKQLHIFIPRSFVNKLAMETVYLFLIKENNFSLRMFSNYH